MDANRGSADLRELNVLLLLRWHGADVDVLDAALRVGEVVEMNLV